MGYRPWGLKESDTTEQLNTLNSAGLSNAGLLFTDDSSDFYMVTAPAFRSLHSHSNPVKWTPSSSPLCVCVCVCVCKVASDSLQSHGLWPARFLCLWDFFPGKNTSVGCHFLLEGIFPTQGLKPSSPFYRFRN